jgi:hypothetical protein
VEENQRNDALHCLGSNTSGRGSNHCALPTSDRSYTCSGGFIPDGANAYDSRSFEAGDYSA